MSQPAGFSCPLLMLPVQLINYLGQAIPSWFEVVLVHWSQLARDGALGDWTNRMAQDCSCNMMIWKTLMIGFNPKLFSQAYWKKKRMPASLVPIFVGILSVEPVSFVCWSFCSELQPRATGRCERKLDGQQSAVVGGCSPEPSRGHPKYPQMLV